MSEPSPSERLNAAVQYVNGGKLDSARAICEALIRDDPRSPDAHFLLSVVHLRFGKPIEAELELRDAIQYGGLRQQYTAHMAEIAKSSPRAEVMQMLLRAAYGTNAMVIHYLEMDITAVCNLKCPGCTHYSNYGTKGILPFAEGGPEMERWAARLMPSRFRILGGEPTINPELCDYIRKAHQLWPKAMREVVSNGFFVDRHPELYRTLAETGTALEVSLHENTPDYLQKSNIEKIREASRTHKFQLKTLGGTSDDFWQAYRGQGPDMMPFNDGNPNKSWEICGGCACITKGKLWKCPNIGHLHLADELFDLKSKEEWRPYLAHQGMGLEASDREIYEYLYRTHYICSMCPSYRLPMSMAMAKD